MRKRMFSLTETLLIRRRISKKHFYNNSPCWIWLGARNSQGRGSIRVNDEIWQTHRLAAKFWLKDFKEELQVLHHCDNGLCFNPAHLWQGTHKDNMQDAVRKGRHSTCNYIIQGSKKHENFDKFLEGLQKRYPKR